MLLKKEVIKLYSVHFFVRGFCEPLNLYSRSELQDPKYIKPELEGPWDRWSWNLRWELMNSKTGEFSRQFSSNFIVTLDFSPCISVRNRFDDRNEGKEKRGGNQTRKGISDCWESNFSLYVWSWYKFLRLRTRQNSRGLVTKEKKNRKREGNKTSWSSFAIIRLPA